MFEHWTLWLGGAVALILAIATYDVLQSKNSILHNFPVLGHLRFILIEIGPEIRQYLVASNREEQPFNRLEREWIYHSADRKNNYFGFGTDDQLYGIGYPIIKHSVFSHPNAAKTGNTGKAQVQVPCAKVIGQSHGRRKPYQPTSIVNISAMSFGALGRNATRALNLGAGKANCFHNTGEGGVGKHHRNGADLCWQIGTGYFGANKEDGSFDIERLRSTVESTPEIKLIEIKLSQGAKPGKGGVLPAAKVTAEIAEARGVPEGKDCISPSTHSAFTDVDSLIEFIENIAEASGLPVGIKSAIGQRDFWIELAEKMKATGKGPDFITIDGGEGGTGAAPLTFADHVSLPYKLGFTRVYRIFNDLDLVDDITWIGSGKLGFPDRAIVAIALGADMINVAREAMLSIGCIQAQKCHTGFCPTGVATHSSWLERGLDPEINAGRFAAYINAFLGELMGVTHASGYSHPGEFTPYDIEVGAGPNTFKPLREIFGYDKKQYAPGQTPKYKAESEHRKRKRELSEAKA